MSGLGLGQLAAHGFAKLTGAQRAAGAIAPVAATASNSIVLPDGSYLLNSAVTQRPALRPSLSVDWTLRPTAAALTAAGWTISRAGEMTYFGPVPVKVAENLFVRSADFGNAAWAKTGLVAPAAVTDESGLVGSKVVALAISGYKSLHHAATGINLGGTTYRVRFLLKASEYTKAIIGDTASARAAACFDLAAGTILNTGSGATAALPGGGAGSAGAGYISSSITPHELGGGLYWCELVMTSVAAGTSWGQSVAGYPDSGATLDRYGAQYTGDGTSGIEVYAAQLQHNFDGDYVPTTDVPITQYAPPLLTAAANELAYQHNSRGECVGLLQYPADTNLILQSQNLGHASWSKSMVSVASTKRLWAGSAPFWRIARTESTNTAGVMQAVSFTGLAAITAYTATVALMGDQWSGCTTGVVGILNVSGSVWPTQAAVVISGPGSVSVQLGVGSISVVGLSTTVPTLIRITAQIPVGATSIGVYIYPLNSGAGASGAAILATRVHLSASPRYMPYIPTTTAAVTRGVQSVVFGGSAFAAVNNPVEGTLLVRASVEDLVFVGEPVLAYTLFGANANHRQVIRLDNNTSNTSGITVKNGSTPVWTTRNSVISTSPSVVAFAFSETASQLGANGGVSPLDTSSQIPQVDNFVAGSNWNLPGLYQRTELYPRAMTSAELAAITTPGVLV